LNSSSQRDPVPGTAFLVIAHPVLILLGQDDHPRPRWPLALRHGFPPTIWAGAARALAAPGAVHPT
jgi:hypothetical protein